MKKFIIFALCAVLGAICEEISEELKEKIKEASCEARCLEKIVQNLTCVPIRCNCSTDSSEKKSDFSKTSGTGPLSEPTLYCKDEHILSFKWEIKQPLIYLVEYRTDNHKKWRFENKTTCSVFRINKLDANTHYQIRIWGVSLKGELFGPSDSTWVKTNPVNYTPDPVIQLNITKWLLREEDYTAIVSWQPAEDRACFYDFMWFGHDHNLDYKQKEVRLNNELFQTELPNFEFGTRYTVEIASRTGDMKRESNKTTIHVDAPTCLETYGNLTKCSPPKPQNVQVEEKVIDDVNLENPTYNVRVSWAKPKLLPDNYTVNIYVLKANTSTISLAVSGNETSATFRNVSLGVHYQVGLFASSRGGDGPFALVDKQLKLNLHIASPSPSTSSDSTQIPIILGSVGGVVLLGVIIVMVLYRRCSLKLSKRQSDNMMSKYYSESYNEKCPSSLTNMTVEYYLPDIVNDEWQMDPEKVVLDQFLDEGAFGVVHKGYMKKDDGSEIEVAVKMLKGNPTGDEIRQFESEIEIMKSVGSHPHLVSLLGCCSKLGHLGPFLIVEYCAKGSLLKYLRSVWDQISTQEEDVRYVNTPHLPEDVVDENHFSNKVYELFDDSLLEPRDLLSFARQTVLGMEYLSSVRVVHRDLAARNVLMCSNRTVKVADFGLSRDVYQDNIYLKTGAGKLPVKWMAMESLSHQQYTIQSDVWSFGILLWEIVTLGGNPYSTISPKDLFSLLRSGYRMECPKNCSEEVYDIMKSCWKENPKERPNFSDLRNMLEKLLENENRYISLDVRH